MITDKFLQATEKHLPKSGILLLGDQVMDIYGNQGTRATAWFWEQGYERVADVDINGQAGFTHDLSKFDAALFEDTWHCIADFGALEHIEDPANALRNLFAWLKVGGLQIHVSPNRKYQDAEHEGLPRFELDFWIEYADIVGYEVMEARTIQAYDSTGEICDFVVMKKILEGAPKKKDIQGLINEFAYV